MNEYAPDAWKVIKIVTPTETVYKLFSTWYGSFTQGDSWRLNSGITNIKKAGKVYEITGYSGSVYTVPVHENCYRTTAYTGNILKNLIENAKDIEVHVLPFDTDWENLIVNIKKSEKGSAE
jgi:hypothetical protein